MTTIADVLDTFLAEQEARLSERTYRRYDEVIWLFRDCMNGYGHSSLSELERKRFEAAYDDDPEAYVHLFGPDKIPGLLGEFLGWFIIRKTMASQELLRAAGTVTKKLSNWLEANGHISDLDGADMADRANDAATELPAADRLGDILFDQTRSLRHFDPDDIPDEYWLEDMFVIERVEPGKLWFVGHPDPVIVPAKASAIAQEGWDITGTIARFEGPWRFVEVGNVYP